MALESRRSATLVNRKDHRNSLLKRLRNIPDNMSPLPSPMPPKKKVNNPNISVTKPEHTTVKTANKTDQPKNKRLEQLKKWKQERDRRKLEEKKKAKPVFKVYHVEHKDNLDTIFNNIPRKPSQTANSIIKQNGLNEVKPAKTPTKSKKSSDKLGTRAQNSIKVQSSTSRKNPEIRPPPSRTRLQSTTTSNSRETTKKSEVPIKTDSKVLSKKSAKGAEVNKTAKKSRTIDMVQTEMKNDNATEIIDSDLKSHSSFGEVKSRTRSTKKAEVKTQEEKHDSSAGSDSTAENERLEAREDRLKKNEYKQEIYKKDDIPKRKNTKVERQNAVDLPNFQSAQSNRRTTRRQKSEEDTNTSRKNTPQKTPKKKNQTLPSPKSGNRSSARKSLEMNTDSNEKDTSSSYTTPKKEATEDICYVSPFVTMSRGKGAARKEFEQRKSLNRSISAGGTDPRSPKAAADYFTKKLEDEIKRIQLMCQTWQNYKDEADLSEDACGLIDMTIGQSNLLITKKFNQFRGLIEKCQAKDEVEMTIKCEDLHGFWDMMYKQVTDLDKRFVNLEDMKKNNWLEKEPKIKTPKPVVTRAKRKLGAKKTSKASSLLKETILAARKNRTNVNSEGDIEILIAKSDKTPKRKSRSQKELSTPMRGILKSSSVKTDKRKTVIFQNLRNSVDGNEEGLTSVGHIKGTPIPSRRSQRISLNRSKLTFE